MRGAKKFKNKLYMFRPNILSRNRKLLELFQNIFYAPFSGLFHETDRWRTKRIRLGPFSIRPWKKEKSMKILSPNFFFETNFFLIAEVFIVRFSTISSFFLLKINKKFDFIGITLNGVDKQTSDFRDQKFFWWEAETILWLILPCPGLKKSLYLFFQPPLPLLCNTNHCLFFF